MTTLSLEVLVPDGVVLQIPIRALQATDASGRFGIWPGHEDLVTVLEPCLVVYRDAADHEKYAAVDGGTLVVEQGLAKLACREAILAETLEDLGDRASALLNQRQRTEQTARGEFAELQATLLRQLSKAEVRP